MCVYHMYALGMCAAFMSPLSSVGLEEAFVLHIRMYWDKKGCWEQLHFGAEIGHMPPPDTFDAMRYTTLHYT